MYLHGLPLLYAAFVWWFATGVVILLDNLPSRTFRYSMAGGTVLLGVALYGLWVSGADASVHGAYVAFTCAMVVWGWQELSFYTGYVTGPRRRRCEEGCGGLRHFGHALQASLYHELAILASAVAVVGLTRGMPNQVGTWTFMVLWWMHESARLNVFLGVRNLNEDFLPAHLDFLRSFFRRRSMNLLFPVSVTLSTVAAVLLVQAAFAPGASGFAASGLTFLAAMMVLAILEHWFLILPLPFAALWGWSVRRVASEQPRGGGTILLASAAALAHDAQPQPIRGHA